MRLPSGTATAATESTPFGFCTKERNSGAEGASETVTGWVGASFAAPQLVTTETSSLPVEARSGTCALIWVGET